MECAGHQLGACIGPASIRCGACGAVRYCSRSHQKAHWVEHSGDCERLAEQMQGAMSYNDFPFSFTEEATWLADAGIVTKCLFLERRGLHGVGLWRAECECFRDGCESHGPAELNQDDDWHLPSTMCPCTNPCNSTSAPLASWIDYYKWRQLPPESPVALLLHWPLTVYHALSFIISQNLLSLSGQLLRILYLGPEKELKQLPVFGELTALLRGAHLHIDFVGPAIPATRDGDLVVIHGFPRCSDADCGCKTTNGSSQGSLLLKLWKGMYHDRHLELSKGSRPHLILAANAGIAAFSSWRRTIELIVESGVPALFTDYCEEAGFLAQKCTQTVSGSTVSHPVQLNPFRQPFAAGNNCLEVPTYSNCVIFGLN